MSSSVSAAITWRWKSATDIGDSAKRRSRPSDFRIRNAWCAKSNSMSKLLSPAGIGDVVSPFAVTWRVEPQEWFSQGDSASRILPTIWTNMCTVDRKDVGEGKGGGG